MIRSLRNLIHGTPLIHVVEGEVRKDSQAVFVETDRFYPRWVYLKCKSIFLHDELFFIENDTSILNLKDIDEKFEITLHSLDYSFDDRRFLLRFTTKSRKLYKVIKKSLKNQREEKKNGG